MFLENSFHLKVSHGEIIDKCSILDLKLKYIKDEKKILEIKREKEEILSINIDIKKYEYFYKLLLHINELIWLDTDIIKSMTIENKEYENILKFSEVSNRIFVNNQKRFRLKNYFNVLQQSHINEQKSYSQNTCFIQISNEEDIYNKISELNYLFISYDVVYISSEYIETIKKLFLNPNIEFVSFLYIKHNEPFNNIKVYDITAFNINDDVKNNYDYEPIHYISGGKLGDFLNQLSVVCEKFYETGRKGRLYIGNYGDSFTFGLEHTYNDTYNAIIHEKYIKEYKIYNGEKIDIDLSSWRNNFHYIQTFKEIYSNNYNVDWAKHKWLTGKKDNYWEDKIIINVTMRRFLSNNSLQKMKEIIHENTKNIVFVEINEDDYNFFSEKIGFKIPYYKPVSFDDTISIVNSCKFAYIGQSAFGVIANSLKKDHILITSFGTDGNLNNFVGVLPNVLDAYL
jgi:hypothetical protein